MDSISGFSYLEDGRSPPLHQQKIHLPPPHLKKSPLPPPPVDSPTKFLFPSHQKSITPPVNKNFQVIT